ncbi:hypothetical protein EDD18DRAFT_1139463 [Armillaria luteobubalina]|uniref:Uncharacterized protein n=1 Tax=Armillaria luteobubalina TaxID=153913 RepID=A0AA39QH09_9AGAR|nr:hypothetical protein EDD18DRAFT_1139463 [Armillaria luteobubalina]
MQTRSHIIRECPRQRSSRANPQGVKRHLFSGHPRDQRRVEVLTSFLEKSGAFTKTGNPKQPPMRPTLDGGRIYAGGSAGIS